MKGKEGREGSADESTGCCGMTCLSAELLQLLFQNILQLPVRLELGNAKQEVLDSLHTPVCVLDFRMVL